MATLIAVYTSDGLMGRCDARCYEATSPICDCICGGCNHGAGLSQALDNTRRQVEQWVETYTHKKGLIIYTIEQHPESQQPTLWSEL